MARGSDAVASVSVRVAAVALVVLAATIVLGWARLVPLPLVTLLGLYGAQLAIDDEPLDPAAALVAATAYLTLELAYWSLEERDGVRAGRGDVLGRIGIVAGMAVAALLLATAVLALADALRTRGLAVDVVGATAAAAALGAIVLLARRRAEAGG